MNEAKDFEFEDEILEEWNVFIGTELTPFLHLTPLPTSTLSARFNNSPTTTTLTPTTSYPWKFKPRARRLEFGLAFDDLGAENLQGDRMRELNMGERGGQRMVGSGWQWRRVQYLLGRFTDGELHLTPVESVIPLNPSLNHLDELDARLKLSASSINSSGTTSRRPNHNNSLEDSPISPANANSNSSTSTSTSGNAAKAIQVQFRKKETEEQVQARLNSFAHLQRQIDDEPWINLKYYSSKAPEVDAVRDKLIVTCRDSLEFLPNEDYLHKIINFNSETESLSSLTSPF